MFGIDLTEFLLLLAIGIPAAALVGHMRLAYIDAPNRAVTRVKTWLQSDDGKKTLHTSINEYYASDDGKKLQDQAAAVVLAKLPEAPEFPELPDFPKPPTPEEISAAAARGIEQFYKSDASSEIADAVADRVKGAVDGSISGQWGNLHKVGIKQMERALLRADFRDPLKNLAWQQFIGSDYGHQLAKVLVQGLAQDAGSITVERGVETSDGSSDYGDWMRQNGGR